MQRVLLVKDDELPRLGGVKCLPPTYTTNKADGNAVVSVGL